MTPNPNKKPKPKQEEWESLAKQLHDWYLEACQQPESGMDFNPAAQEPYDLLKETQKFIDRYIAGKVSQLIQQAHQEGKAEGSRGDYGRKMYQQARKEVLDEVTKKVEEMKECHCGGIVKRIVPVHVFWCPLGDSKYNQALQDLLEWVGEKRKT